MDSTVHAHRRGVILLLRLDNATGYPRLTRAVLEELDRHLDAAEHDAGLRAVILSGTEQAFAVGADLSEVSALDAAEALRFSRLGQSLMRRIETSPKPIVAAIRGYCLGGGFDLALACQMRIAGDDAVFGHPGGSLGILTGWGGTQRLPRLVGRGTAVEMLTTGRNLTASEACSFNLVHRVVPAAKTLDAAIEWTRTFRPAREPAEI